MSAAEPDGDESVAVMAFIHARQADILKDAIEALTACEPADLPQVVHALHGTLGSYRLVDADTQVTALARLVADSDTSLAAADLERRRTVDALRALSDGLGTGEPS